MKKLLLTPITHRIHWVSVKENTNGVYRATGKPVDLTDEVLSVAFQWFMRKIENNKEQTGRYNIRYGNLPYVLEMRRIEDKPKVIIKSPRRNGYCDKLEDIKNTLYYISRNGELDLEDFKGKLISGKKEIDELLLPKRVEETEFIVRVKESQHIVLSMPPNTDPAVLKKTVREFTDRNYCGASWVMVQHLDASRPHYHIVILYNEVLIIEDNKIKPLDR